MNPRGRRQEIKIPENSFDLKIQHLEPSSCKPLSSLRKSNHFLEFDSTMMKPNVHGMCRFATYFTPNFNFFFFLLLIWN